MLIRALLMMFLFFCNSYANADYIPEWERFHEVKDKVHGNTTYDYDRLSLKKVSLRDTLSIAIGALAWMSTENLEEEMRPRYLQVYVREKFSEPYKVDNFIASSEIRYMFFDCENPGFVLDRQVFYKSSYLDGESYTQHPSDNPFKKYWIKDIKNSNRYGQFAKILYQKFSKMCN